MAKGGCANCGMTYTQCRSLSKLALGKCCSHCDHPDD